MTTRIWAAALALLLAGGCAFGPRPAPKEPDKAREKAIRGAVHFENGRLDRAERDFKKAIWLDQAEDRLASLSRDYNNLAALALRQGDYGRALEYLARAAGIHRQAGEKAGLARSLAAMAAVEDLAGRPDEAARLIEEALGLVPEAGGARLYVLNVKGWHLLEAGDLAAAEAPLQEAIEIGGSVAGADSRLLAATRHHLGRCLLERGDLKAARGLLEDALELDRQGKYPAGIASDLDQLAALEATEGRLDEACALYERAFNLYVYLKDVRRARALLARLERHNLEARLGLEVLRLREALARVEEASARAGYSLGSTSTTQ
jgi:tetratricopeptide (TPR) repeat protein